MGIDKVNGEGRAISVEDARHMVFTESGIIRLDPLYRYQQTEAGALLLQPQEDRLQKTIDAISTGGDAIVILRDLAHLMREESLSPKAKAGLAALGRKSKDLVVQSAAAIRACQQVTGKAQRPAPGNKGVVSPSQQATP